MAVCPLMGSTYPYLKTSLQFHSDSEIGLGPFVAGLSLGSPALMHFRLRPKYDTNQDNKSIAISFVLRHVSSFESSLDHDY
jgi:hypothetical protein